VVLVLLGGAAAHPDVVTALRQLLQPLVPLAAHHPPLIILI
jgi:hypothetical protein